MIVHADRAWLPLRGLAQRVPGTVRPVHSRREWARRGGVQRSPCRTHRPRHPFFRPLLQPPPIPLVLSADGTCAQTTEAASVRVPAVGRSAQRHGTQTSRATRRSSTSKAGREGRTRSAAHRSAHAAWTAEPANTRGAPRAARCARGRLRSLRLQRRAVLGAEQPHPPPVRSREQECSHARNERVDDAHRPPAEPSLEPRGQRVRGSILLPCAFDAARVSSRSRIHPRKRSSARDPPRGRHRSLFVSGFIRRVGSASWKLRAAGVGDPAAEGEDLAAPRGMVDPWPFAPGNGPKLGVHQRAGRGHEGPSPDQCAAGIEGASARAENGKAGSPHGFAGEKAALSRWVRNG
jgi:hypothetical protein